MTVRYATEPRRCTFEVEDTGVGIAEAQIEDIFSEFVRLGEVEVEGLGTLSNTIVQGPVPIRDDCGAQPSESEEVISTAQGGDWEFRGIRPPRRD